MIRRRFRRLVSSLLLVGAVVLVLPAWQSAEAQPGTCDPAGRDGCPLAVGRMVVASLVSGEDVHLWRVNVPTSGRLAAYLSGRQTQADLDLHAADPAGNIVGSSVLSGSFEQSRFDIAGPGEYLVYVSINPSRDRAISDIVYELLVFASNDIWSALPVTTASGQVLVSALGPIKDFAVAPQGGLMVLAASGDETTIRRVSDGALLQQLAVQSKARPSREYATSDELKVTQGLQPGQAVEAAPSDQSTTTRLTGGATSVAITRDGQLVGIGTGDERLQVWRSVDGTLLWERGFENRGQSPPFTRILGLLFSPDGQMLVSRIDRGPHNIKPRFGSWRTTDGSPVWGDGEENGPFATDMAFSPDSATLAVLFQRSLFGLVLVHASDRTSIRQVEAVTWQESPAGVAFAPDGETLAVGLRDGQARIIRLTDGAVLRTFQGGIGYVYGVAFSPDGRFLLTTSVLNCRIWTWTSECIDPDGRDRFEESWDNTTRLWSVADGTLRRVFSGPIRQATFLPDGLTIIAALDDGTIRRWNLEADDR